MGDSITDSDMSQIDPIDYSMKKDLNALTLNEASSVTKTPQGPGGQLPEKIQCEVQSQQQHKQQQSQSSLVDSPMTTSLLSTKPDIAPQDNMLPLDSDMSHNDPIVDSPITTSLLTTKAGIPPQDDMFPLNSDMSHNDPIVDSPISTSLLTTKPGIPPQENMSPLDSDMSHNDPIDYSMPKDNSLMLLLTKPDFPPQYAITLKKAAEEKLPFMKPMVWHSPEKRANVVRSSENMVPVDQNIDKNPNNIDKNPNNINTDPVVIKSFKHYYEDEQFITLTRKQLISFHLAYEMEPFPTWGTLKFLAKEEGIYVLHVENWFNQNRETSSKKITTKPHTNRMYNQHMPFKPDEFRKLVDKELKEDAKIKKELKNQKLKIVYR